MSDARVFSVEYSFHPAEGHEYASAAEWRGRLGDFDLALSGTVLLATPTSDFASEADARASLEPHLRAWELRSDLEDGVPVRFAFKGSTVFDLTPDERGGSAFLGAAASFHAEGSVVTHHRQFPTPAGGRLAMSPLVDELELIEEAATSSIGTLAARNDIVHAFVFAGWENQDPIMGVVANLSLAAPNDPVQPTFHREEWNPPPDHGTFLIAGGGQHAISPTDRRLLERLARRRPSRAADLAQVLVDVNRRAAEARLPASRIISRHCVTSHMESPGRPNQPGVRNQPVASNLHLWGEEITGISSVVPRLSHGVDFTEMFEVLVESTNQLSKGEATDTEAPDRRLREAAERSTRPTASGIAGRRR